MPTRRLRRALACTIGATLGFVLALKPSPDHRPRPTFTLSRRMANCSFREKVWARVRVYEPTLAWRCASVAWDWGDGCKSEHSFDCNLDEIPPDVMFLSEGHPLHRPGTWHVGVRLTYAGKVIYAPAPLELIVGGPICSN